MEEESTTGDSVDKSSEKTLRDSNERNLRDSNERNLRDSTGSLRDSNEKNLRDSTGSLRDSSERNLRDSKGGSKSKSRKKKSKTEENEDMKKEEHIVTIWEACRTGDLTFLQEQVGFNFNQADEHYRTPIYYAALCGHEKIVDFLLSKAVTVQYHDEIASLTDDIRRKMKVARSGVITKKIKIKAATQQQQQQQEVKEVVTRGLTMKAIIDGNEEELKKEDEAIDLAELYQFKIPVTPIILAFDLGRPYFVDILAKKGANTFSLDILNTLNKEMFFSDIVLETLTDPIFAHRIVLHSRCPPFLQYLESLKEPPPFVVENKTHFVVPFKKASLLAFLSFLYSDYLFKSYLDEVLGQTDLKNELLSLATQFHVEKLEEIFVAKQREEPIKKNLTEPNINLASVFDNPSFSDKLFIAEGKRIYVSRMVMCARSEYYRRMFLSGMKEAYEYETIVPHSYTAFHAFLQYLYTSTIPDLSPDDAMQNLVLSSEYLLYSLKKQAEMCILRNGIIDEENCIDVAQFAGLHEAKHLMRAATDWILNNLHKLDLTNPGLFYSLDPPIKQLLMSLLPPEHAKIYLGYEKMMKLNASLPSETESNRDKAKFHRRKKKIPEKTSKQTPSKEIPKQTSSKETPKQVPSKENSKQTPSKQTQKPVSSKKTSKQTPSKENSKQTSSKKSSKQTSKETSKQTPSKDSSLEQQQTSSPSKDPSLEQQQTPSPSKDPSSEQQTPSSSKDPSSE